MSLLRRVNKPLYSRRDLIRLGSCFNLYYGSEFINTHVFTFCQRPGKPAIQFTRSRAYKKDDNAHIEQKNWTHVRKLLGWARYETPQARVAINALYADLRIFQNLFQPSMKLVTKVRQGSRLLRRYDTPKTPFQRLLECQPPKSVEAKRLHRLLQTTDPFELSQRIDRHLERLPELASRSKGPPRAQPRGPSWRGWTFSPKLRQQQQAMIAQEQRRLG